jgi:porin
MARWAGVPPIRIETVSRTKRRFGQLLLAAALLAAGAAAAQEDKKTDDDKPADPDTGESTVEEKTLGLLPNPFQKYGVKFAATYIGEVLGNPSGGLKQGSVYEGRLNLAVDLDLQKLAGLDQLTFHANMFQIHGGGLSRGSLQNYFVVSGIEALPSTRLYEAYFEKQWGNKKASLKVGQLAADSEFFNTKYTDVLTNASMGWPAITSLDLPSGGPSPPLAAMGARLLVNVTEQLSVLGGIFDGDQAGPGPGDPQERNRYGVNFRVNDPPLLLGQIQYGWNNTKGDPNPAGQIKFGGWRHFGSFADQLLASNGVSLASPVSSGEPLLLSGDVGGWMLFEQKLYRVPKSDDRGIGIFARVSGAPADRNLIDRYRRCRHRVHRPRRPPSRRQVRNRGRLRACVETRPEAECGLSHIRRSRLADAEFRRPTDSCVSISDQGRVDVTAQSSIHHPSGRRCHQPLQCNARQGASQCDRVWPANDPEVLSRVPVNLAPRVAGNVETARMTRDCAVTACCPVTSFSWGLSCPFCGPWKGQSRLPASCF